MTNCKTRKRQPARRLLGCCALLCVATASAGPLDPLTPPGGNFDLRHWKLTLPIAGALEVPPEALTAGFADLQFFHTGPDGAMVFLCPVTGGATVGSPYPRCELRELIDPGDDNVNWSAYGTHVLDARCMLSRIPSTKKVIIGQIHSFSNNARPLVKLQFNNGKIEALVKDSPDGDSETILSLARVGLGDLITYQIKLSDGELSVTVNGQSRSVNVFRSDAAWAGQTFYFKAGNYCLDNAGLISEGATVSFYELDATHTSVTGAPPLLRDFSVRPDGSVGFTLLGQRGGGYVIETSSDLRVWQSLLMTNSISGRVNLIDPKPGAERFYRGRVR